MLIHRVKGSVQKFGVLKSAWSQFRWYSGPAGRRQIWAKVQHFGWGVECPFCGWRGSSFYPHPPPHYRQNAICPKCESKERHRLLFLYLKQYALLFDKPLKVLELAPGPYSHRMFQRLPHITYITLDLTLPSARCHGDIRCLPFTDSSFNLVICYHVFEHVQDDRCAMSEPHRILEADGLLLASAGPS